MSDNREWIKSYAVLQVFTTMQFKITHQIKAIKTEEKNSANIRRPS